MGPQERQNLARFRKGAGTSIDHWMFCVINGMGGNKKRNAQLWGIS